MEKFIETPASKRSISLRRPSYGVGVNDSRYIVRCVDQLGNVHISPFYQVWISMIQRCYSDKLHQRFPKYIGCQVADEWLKFSVFKEWMKKQNWKGKQLDKDLLIHGNKLYSPDTCLFVDQAVNSLLVDKGAARGVYPLGVHLHRKTNKYRAKCAVNGKGTCLGYYDTPEEAHIVYLKFKSNHIAEVAEKYKNDEKLYVALIRNSERLLIKSINYQIPIGTIN